MTGEAEADLLVHRIASDWRRAALSARDRALCAYAEKLTRTPTAMGEADVAALRQAGFSDVAIHDATQVVGTFNHFNRVADALGVEAESFIRAWERGPDQR